MCFFFKAKLFAIAERQEIDAGSGDVSVQLPSCPEWTWTPSSPQKSGSSNSSDWIRCTWRSSRSDAWSSSHQRLLSGFAKIAVTFNAKTLQERAGGLKSHGEAILGTKVDSEERHGRLIFVCMFAGIWMCSGFGGIIQMINSQMLEEK